MRVAQSCSDWVLRDDGRAHNCQINATKHHKLPPMPLNDSHHCSQDAEVAQK